MKPFAKAFYHSALWRDARAYALMRDKYLCRRCGAPATDVHHIIRLAPDNINDPNITLNPGNLESLCDACHKAEHYAEHIGIASDYQFDEDGQPVPVQSPPGGTLVR